MNAPLNQPLLMFEAPFEAIAAARHRQATNPKTGKRHSYTPLRTHEFRTQLGIYGRLAMAGKPALFLPLRLVVTACYKIKPSWSKARKLEAVRGGHSSVPDYDNIAKSVGDALNGIVWMDDKQIVDGRVHKLWGEEAFVRIEVYRYSVGIEESQASLTRRIAEDPHART